MNLAYDLDTLDRLQLTYQGLHDIEHRLAFVRKHPGPLVPVICLACGESGQVPIGWSEVGQALADGCFTGKPRTTVCTQCVDSWDGEKP